MPAGQVPAGIASFRVRPHDGDRAGRLDNHAGRDAAEIAPHGGTAARAHHDVIHMVLAGKSMIAEAGSAASRT
jgi:hypothetical protein